MAGTGPFQRLDPVFGGRDSARPFLPPASVTDIEYKAGTVFAATFGRGVYSMRITPALLRRIH
ncbi:hypothetical protein NE236_08320 [Actinoallomurus purpureus]|uniref:hypothetical protein n=1 Tax=Actinoallomurus purpureus TaxID=478114 RepID=UPI002093247D|nr:hypothetical protein [Actinoallomurus purpureus]MCO6004984.1 hypothetical protein [Actinoallomurus purpureus]